MATYYGTVLRLREATADPSALDVHIIKPGWGSSGYYPEQTLKTAVSAGAYPSGMHMYWDHATEREEFEKPERSLSVLAGALTSDARYEANGWDGPGVYATAKAFPEFADSIGAMGDNIGVSHSVYGEAEWGEAEGKEGMIIKEITPDPFNSVDFVTLPGAGGHYRTVFAEAAKRIESKTTKKGEPMVTIEEARKDKALMETLRAEIMKEVDAGKLAESLKESQKENKELRESLKEARAKQLVQESRTYVVAKVAESKLPEASKKVVVESIISQDLPASDDKLDTVKMDEAIKAAIEAKQAEIDAILTEAHTDTGVHDMGAAASTGEDAKIMYRDSLVKARFSIKDANKLAGIKEE